MKRKALWLRAKSPCKDCHGSGRIVKCSENTVGSVPCPTCKGSGVSAKPLTTKQLLAHWNRKNWKQIKVPNGENVTGLVKHGNGLVVFTASKTYLLNPKTRQIKPQRKRTTIRPRSLKMSKKMAQYRRQKAVFIAKYSFCQRCDNSKPQEIHHSRGRVSTLLLDERFWFALCRLCHLCIHQFPSIARKQGWLCKVGDWNKPVALNIEPLSDESLKNLPY